MLDKEVSRVYAGALMEMGEDAGNLSQLEEELGFLADLFMQDKDLMIFFNAPVISRDSKKNFIDKVFSGKFCDDIICFLKVLIDNNRQSLISDIHIFLIGLIDELSNQKRVRIVSNARLATDLIKEIKKAIGDNLGKEIIMEEEIDETILGGIIVKIDDRVIDGSIVKDLKSIRENLLDCEVGSEVAYED